MENYPDADPDRILAGFEQLLNTDIQNVRDLAHKLIAAERAKARQARRRRCS